MSKAFMRAAALSNYIAVARDVGLNPYKLLRGEGVDVNSLANPDTRLPAEKVMSLLETSARLSSRADFALRIAESRRIKDFGAISLLISHQPTLRDVLSTLTRYLNSLNEALAMHVVDNGELAIVKEELVVDVPGPKTQCVELVVGVMYGLLKDLLGDDWRPLSVHFTHAAPADLSTHRRFLKGNLEFESSFNGVVLSVADLQKPNRAGDPALAQYAQHYLDTMHPDSPKSVINEVRKTVYLLLPLGTASIERVARTLGLHERTLQRRLAAEGYEFTALVKEARRDLALRYITDKRHSITRISETLGYGQISSFTRWFSVEFGVSPAEWRRRHTAAPPASSAGGSPQALEQ